MMPLATLASVVLTCVCWLRIPRPRGAFWNRVGVLFLVALAVELNGTITWTMKVHNGWVYTLYQGIEVLLLMGIAHLTCPPLRKWTLPIAGTGALVLALDVRYLHSASLFANTGIMICAVMLAIALLVLLWHRMEQLQGPVFADARIWLYLGMLLYFTALAPVMGSTEHIWRRYPRLAANLYVVIQVACVLRYLCAAAACLMAARQHHGRDPG